MTIRARIDDETVERVNDQLENVMRVDPADAGMDTKINILIDELEEEKRQRTLDRQSGENGGFGQGGL